MWKCHKCGKPVYFAERKQSLGYDWHPECLRCEECGKRLNPGQHAEHKGVPYCHVPCYGALFGPQLFGHGTRVESHKSFGQKVYTRPTGGPTLPRDHLESKIKFYNQFFDSKSLEIRSREVNGRLVLEGALKVFWGIHGVIHLKEDDDQRTLVTVRKRNSCRYGSTTDFNVNDVSDKENLDGVESCMDTSISSSIIDDTFDAASLTESLTYETCSLTDDLNSVSSNTSKEVTPTHKSSTLPTKFELNKLEWDEIDDLLQVERKVDKTEKLYQTMPSPLPSQASTDLSDYDDSTSKEMVTANDTTATSNSSSSSTTTSKSSQKTMPKSQQMITSTTTINDYDDDDDIITPSGTLKPCDYDDFKKQMNEEFISNTSQLRNTTDNTLKLNQPIDPSRINDSLKLYSENMMSKSYNCEHTSTLRTLNDDFNKEEELYDDRTLVNSEMSNSLYVKRRNLPIKNKRNYILQKSDSESTPHNTLTSDESWIIGKGLNRSKSGPNCFGYNSETDNDTDQMTLKPSTIKKKLNNRQILIKMDCYDEITKKVTNKNMDNLELISDAAGGDTRNTDENISVRNNINLNGAIVSTSNNNSNDVDDDDEEEDEEAKSRRRVKLQETDLDGDYVVLRKPRKSGSTAIKRRSGNRRSRTKLKRRCSINGHFYNRETSFFTPPHGSQMSVWVTSLVNTQEVINLLLEKYKVDSKAENFALFVIRDNGEQRRLKEDEYPLVVRVMLGPHEEVSRLFLMDAQDTEEISSEVAQFLNLSIPECKAILDKYNDEQEREVNRIKDRYAEMRKRITQRMESLKVRL